MGTTSARWIRRSLAAALMLSWLPLSAEPVPEYDLKAAFVYNFALFTDWPAETSFEGGNLNICINAYSPLRQPLISLGDRAVKGRKIAVRTLAADKLDGCNIVFIDSSGKGHWPDIRKRLGSAVLTIADNDDIERDGVVIAMAMDGNRIVFDIDTRAARQAGLALSSKLLRLARSVQ